MADLLVAARCVHFASTATVAGVAVFQCFIVGPAVRAYGASGSQALRGYCRQLDVISGAGLTLAILSGTAWFLAVAINIGVRDPAAILADGTARLLLTETQFGHVWLTRLLLAALLFAFLGRPKRAVIGVHWRAGLSALSAAGLMGSLAWSGHAGGMPGLAGDLHVAADVLHLVAASAWLGGLLPLTLLLGFAGKKSNRSLALVARDATRRFSTLGMIGVGTLLATGLVNARMLVGALPGLFGTDYGRLLLAKIALFAAMIGIAAVNRLRLMPVLPDTASIHRLKRNVLVEIGLGLAILALVSVLGILPPPAHAAMQMQ